MDARFLEQTRAQAFRGHQNLECEELIEHSAPWNKERRAKRPAVFRLDKPKASARNSTQEMGDFPGTTKQKKPSAGVGTLDKGVHADFFGASSVASALGIRSGATPCGRIYTNMPSRFRSLKPDISTLPELGHFYFALTPEGDTRRRQADRRRSPLTKANIPRERSSVASRKFFAESLNKWSDLFTENWPDCGQFSHHSTEFADTTHHVRLSSDKVQDFPTEQMREHVFAGL